MLSESRKSVDNTVAMREALERVKQLFDGRLMWEPDIRKAHAAVNAALASPARNCDVYRTVEEAEVACRNDRGYCSSPIEERESTIRFMFQDVKDNSFNNAGNGKKEGE